MIETEQSCKSEHRVPVRTKALWQQTSSVVGENLQGTKLEFFPLSLQLGSKTRCLVGKDPEQINRTADHLIHHSVCMSVYR